MCDVMLFFILLLCFLLSFSTLPGPVDPVVDSLPPYQTKTAYTEGGFQDYTNYILYTYDDAASLSLESNPYFVPASAQKDLFLVYLEDYEGWVDTITRYEPSSELVQNYSFDVSLIDENDYLYISVQDSLFMVKALQQLPCFSILRIKFGRFWDGRPVPYGWLANMRSIKKTDP